MNSKHFTPSARALFQAVFDVVRAAVPDLHVRAWYLDASFAPAVGPGIDVCWNFTLPPGALEAETAKAPWPRLIGPGDLLRVKLVLRESHNADELELAAQSLGGRRVSTQHGTYTFQRLRSTSHAMATFMLSTVKPIP